MKLLIDTANIAEIKALYQIFRFDGVTTNPKLLSRMDGDPIGLLKEIRREIPKDAQLHVQVVSLKADDMIKEADYILEQVGGDTCIKVPVSGEGFKAIRILANRGIKVTATAVFNQAQALLAAHEGASFAAPYIHRINNKGYGGVDTALEIHRALKAQQFDTELLAAAFENTDQVSKILAGGAQSVTVAPDILKEMLVNSMTEDAVKDFYHEFSQHFHQESLLETK